MGLSITSKSAEETIEIGRRIGRKLKGGEILAVCGELGAGKTCLIKGIAAGGGAEASGKEVVSPTFVIVKEYGGRFDIYHMDAYRLNSVEEFERIGFDDFCYPESIVMIEWADKIEPALEGIDYVRIELVFEGQTQRKIHIQGAAAYLELSSLR